MQNIPYFRPVTNAAQKPTFLVPDVTTRYIEYITELLASVCLGRVWNVRRGFSLLWSFST